MRLPGAVASAGGGPASDGGQASLVSWNLLAPEYADPAKYPWTSAAHLSWEARAPRIVERIGELDADAVALQEVPLARWDALYAELQPLGYDAELQTLSRGSARRGHPVANAVLLKSDRLRCVRAEPSLARADHRARRAHRRRRRRVGRGGAAARPRQRPPRGGRREGEDALQPAALAAQARAAAPRGGRPFDALRAAARAALVVAGDFNRPLVAAAPAARRRRAAAAAAVAAGAGAGALVGAAAAVRRVRRRAAALGPAAPRLVPQRPPPRLCVDVARGRAAAHDAGPRRRRRRAAAPLALRGAAATTCPSVPSSRGLARRPRRARAAARGSSCSCST